MSSYIDTFVTYRILRMLTTPFEQTDAYNLGIIDKKGNRIKRPSTAEERDAYNLLHRMVFRLKRIINKVPVENKNFLSFAAAITLIRENKYIENDVLEEMFYMAMEEDSVKQLAEDLENEKIMPFKKFLDEMMGVGGGGVAGIGVENPSVANQAEPGVSKKAQKKWQKKNGMFRRNAK